jgi:hypothetical protein
VLDRSSFVIPFVSPTGRINFKGNCLTIKIKDKFIGMVQYGLNFEYNSFRRLYETTQYGEHYYQR